MGTYLINESEDFKVDRTFEQKFQYGMYRLNMIFLPPFYEPRKGEKPGKEVTLAQFF